MSCFGGRVSQDLYQNCCNANVLCEFDGDMSRVVSEPIYVQKVYDAVLVHLQGMKTVQNQSFVPALPCGHRVKRVIDIRCRRSFIRREAIPRCQATRETVWFRLIRNSSPTDPLP